MIKGSNQFFFFMHSLTNQMEKKITPLQEQQTIPTESSCKLLMIIFKLTINYNLLRIGKMES